MKYYLLAGEASGDLHGSNLVKSLKKEDPSANIRCWGGDLMAAAGAEVVKHYRELAFMGFLEVVKNLPTIARNFRICKADILEFKPDALILIDYPGFNLRMATWAKSMNIRVLYYISPQLWAWHTSRVNIVKKAVERMYVILPFEKEFYEKHGVEVDFVGHPLLDVVEKRTEEDDFHETNKLSKDKPIIALLPGSRRQEVERILKTMLEITPGFLDCQFVVAGAPSLERSFYEPFLEQYPNVFFIENLTYELLQNADAALVTSGTATLETALFNVPQVVCYKGGSISYFLAKRLINKDLQYISLVNLIADKLIVRELIQDEFNQKTLAQELRNLLNEDYRNRILAGYKELSNKLGNTTSASETTAKLMVERLRIKP